MGRLIGHDQGSLLLDLFEILGAACVAFEVGENPGSRGYALDVHLLWTLYL